jgi:hypothetical protein
LLEWDDFRFFAYEELAALQLSPTSWKIVTEYFEN